MNDETMFDTLPLIHIPNLIHCRGVVLNLGIVCLIHSLLKLNIFVELNFCYKSSLNLVKELVILVLKFISPMKLSIKQIPFQPTNLITESVYNLIVLPCSLSSSSSGV